MTPKTRVNKTNISEGFPGGLISLALAAFSVSLASSSPAQGSDFEHAQKVYVPPTNVDRRIDFTSIREQYTLPDGKKPAGKTGTKGSGTGKTASVAKSGTAAGQAASGKTATTTAKAGSTGAKTINKTAAAKPAVKTVIASPAKKTSPVAAVTGQAASSKSISEIAKSLSSKVPPSMVAKLKQTAQEMEKSGKLEEAQRLLTKVGQLSPEDKSNLAQLANIGVQRAKSYIKSNNFQGALLQARTALSANPNNTEASQILGQLYKKAGADPGDVNSRLKTANALYQQSRYAEAEVEYKASLAIKPTAEAHVGIGKVFEKLNGPGQGKQHFEHALEIDSNSALAHRELGMIHLQSGDVVSANSELSRALIIDSSDKEAGSNLVKLWQTQVSKMPNANSHLGLARAYQLNGDLQSAQAEYREVVRIDPNHPYLPAARQSFKIALAKQEAEKSMVAAKNLESQGLYQDAYVKANEAVAYSPGNSAYKIYQGELLEKLGQPGQAKQVYLNILKDDPQNLIAVQKIKNLQSAIAMAPTYGGGGGGGNPAINPATGQAMPGMSAAGMQQSLLPGGNSGSSYPRQPAGFPGTKFPTEMMTQDSTNLANGVGAGQPVDQVGSLGSFMGLLRNQMLGSKGSNQRAEDAAHAAIKALTDPDPPAAAGASAGGGGGSGGAGVGLPADISSLLGGSKAGSAASAAPSAAEGGAASALASAAAALAAARGGGAPPATAAAGSSIAASSPQRLKELQSQNQALQSQLSQMSGSNYAGGSAAASSSLAGAGGFSGLSALSAPSTAATPAPMTAPDFTSPSSSTGASSVSPMSAPSGGASAAPGQLPYLNSNNGQLSAPVSDTTDLRSAIPTNANSADAGLRGPIAGAQPIMFELKQIKPTLTEVQLKVSLRNETSAPIAIPSNLQAIIKYSNLTESQLKVSFDDKTIAPHSTVDGVVKVPFNKVDPSADLVLRNMLPSSDQELHIIKTAISQK